MAKWEAVEQAYLTTVGSSSRLSERAGKTVDNRIVVLHTLTDDGAGHFIGEMGTVNYVGKQFSARLVSFDKTTETYQADHENAKEFSKAMEGQAVGSSQSLSAKGGSYTTAAVSEEMLAALEVRYRVGSGAPRHVTQSYTAPAVVLDLCPLTTDQVIANSVLFKWMGTLYRDLDGVIYRGWTDTSAGIACGVMNYEAGTAPMYDYVVGGTGPTDFQLLSLWTRKGQWTTASQFFNTEAAPLRAGAGGFILTALDTKGTMLQGDVDTQGNITGLHMLGKVDFSRGGVEVQYGDFVSNDSLTAAEKAEWWYSAADVGAVQAGKIWRPWPVLPDSLRYSAVSYICLPVDVSLMGIDPAALPADGRVVYARPGDTAVVGLNISGPEFVPSLSNTYNVGRPRLSFVQVVGPDGAEIFDGYEVDLDAGTVKFTDLAGYPSSVRVDARVEVYRQIAEVRIDGQVKFTQPIGYEFPVGAVFSTALRQGDRYARVTRFYSQKSWDGVTWYDGLNPSIGASTAQFQGDRVPIEVTNLGAITQRWGFKFRNDGITFDLIGDKLGQIATGTINQDFAPINPAAGVPYMTVRATSWSQGWINNNTVFVDTTDANGQMALVRCTQPGAPAGIDDSFWIVQRGDIDRP